MWIKTPLLLLLPSYMSVGDPLYDLLKLALTGRVVAVHNVTCADPDKARWTD